MIRRRPGIPAVPVPSVFKNIIRKVCLKLTVSFRLPHVPPQRPLFRPRWYRRDLRLYTALFGSVRCARRRPRQLRACEQGLQTRQSQIWESCRYTLCRRSISLLIHPLVGADRSRQCIGVAKKLRNQARPSPSVRIVRSGRGVRPMARAQCSARTKPS